MNISREEKKIAIQACINEKGGKEGKVIRVFNEVIKFKRENVEGHFGFIGDKVFIVFRSSDGSLDWKDNFKFHMKTIYNKKKFGRKVQIHAGFKRQYKLVQDMILDKIISFKVFNIIVTGHSLGGALATQLALDIKINFSGIAVGCITFGSPRVGNRYFAKIFNKKVKTSYRYQYGQDMVCGLPLAIMGYWHVNRHIRLAKWKWYNILLFPIVATIGNPFDHYPQKYKEEI